VARELGPLATRPLFQLDDERRAPFAPDDQTLLGGQAQDVALDVEQEIDALAGLEGDRRDRRRVPAAPRMPPAQRLDHRARLSAGRIEPVVAGIGVGLKVAGERLQMPLGNNAAGGAVSRKGRSSRLCRSLHNAERF
jgi:hypothetical protein